MDNVTRGTVWMPRRNPLANGLGACRRAATGQLQDGESNVALSCVLIPYADTEHRLR